MVLQFYKKISYFKVKVTRSEVMTSFERYCLGVYPCQVSRFYVETILSYEGLCKYFTDASILIFTIHCSELGSFICKNNLFRSISLVITTVYPLVQRPRKTLETRFLLEHFPIFAIEKGVLTHRCHESNKTKRTTVRMISRYLSTHYITTLTYLFQLSGTDDMIEEIF